MALRVTLFALLLGLEVILASLAFDGDQLAASSGGPVALLKDGGAWLMRWVVATLVIFGGLAYLRGTLQSTLAPGRIGHAWLAGHGVALGLFGWLSQQIYAGGAAGAWVILWAAAGLAVAATAALTFVPLAHWQSIARANGWLALVSAGGAGLACVVGALSRFLWDPVTATTFTLVKFLVSLIASPVNIQPERSLIGTSNFRVIISPQCSGLEGMGLFLVFGLIWLVVFRDELRFPRALLVLPVGMVAIYLLNAVRIVALLMIGHAGFKQIAARGFHSQAGWIAFSALALLLLLGVRRWQWFAQAPAPAVSAREYPAAPYLLPFLAIVAAAILSQAATATFEWAYALRLLAAAAVLWAFRRQYAAFDWRGGWQAAAAGVLVFAAWIAVDLILGGAPATGMPPELAQASPGLRWFWLATRIAGAVVAVPVAEELAFRAFGLRRLVDEDFEAVPWRRWSWLALIGSSAVFGMFHGRLWVAGVVAGLVYAGVMVRRERIGEAVWAHAITNTMLAAYVLTTGRWDLW